MSKWDVKVLQDWFALNELIYIVSQLYKVLFKLNTNKLLKPPLN